MIIKEKQIISAIKTLDIGNILIYPTDTLYGFGVDATNDKVHKCDEFCSEFICYKYIGETCADEDCCNLYIKTKSNMKYCSVCR